MMTNKKRLILVAIVVATLVIALVIAVFMDRGEGNKLFNPIVGVESTTTAGQNVTTTETQSSGTVDPDSIGSEESLDTTSSSEASVDGDGSSSSVEVTVESYPLITMENELPVIDDE